MAYVNHITVDTQYTKTYKTYDKAVEVAAKRCKGDYADCKFVVTAVPTPTGVRFAPTFVSGNYAHEMAHDGFKVVNCG